ncbi:uncharacterized protein LOC129045653 isoform X2 [Mirounga angustirostris]|uniref:uncharacterized protein LOC129045653 isoform X2 n=1 Tax=Mirounga angustirostris TaxID=9716 RepID=UPI0023E41737|nr:uncharacterized protein LOC129045653 [Mirounga angustirostris]XP_054362307.1 uncharacterized protein LOC129045653 [Mirounga angustirostris]XP_054362308.1 uncharacterized protein LOC129045653 [Mirounga angustirostris]
MQNEIIQRKRHRGQSLECSKCQTSIAFSLHGIRMHYPPGIARPNLCPLCYLATSGPSRVEDYDSPALTPDHAVPPDRCPWAKSRLEGVRRRPRIGNEREAWVAKEAEENMSQQGCTAARTSLIHLPFPRRSAILDIALIWTITSILKPEEEKKGKALSFQAHHEEGAHIFSIHIPWASTLSMDIPRCKGVWEMWS